MMNMWNLVKNQRGQVPGGFFWGGLLGGVGQGFRDLSQQQREREQLAQQKKEIGLREKLLGIQIEKEERAGREAEQRQAGVQDFVNLLTQGAPQELELPGPGEGFAQAPMAQAPQPSAIPLRTPASREQLISAAARAQPKETISQFIKGISPTGGATGQLFSSFPEAQQAAAQQGLMNPRFRQLANGMIAIESGGAVNAAANARQSAIADALKRGLSREQAEAEGNTAFTQILFQGGAASRAGQVAGAAGQTLGEPIQPMQPLAGQPTPQQPLPPHLEPGPTPGTVTHRAQPQTGAYGTPAGGPSSPALRAKQAEASAGAQGKRQVEAQDKLLGLGGLKVTVDRIGELANIVPAGQPGIGRFTQGGVNWYKSLTQQDQNAAELDNKSKAYANILNRSLLAERGVITDRDRQFAIDAIPTIWDTLEARRRKMVTFKGMTDILLWGEEQLSQGRLDPSEFRRQLDAIQSSMGQAAAPQGAGRLIPVLPPR